MTTLQGFAQKVDPICKFPEGKSHATVDVINALTAGVNPPGYTLGVDFKDLEPVIRDVVERAVPGQNWMDVLNASVCKEPTKAMMAHQYRLWGQVRGKMTKMGNTRGLRSGERLLVHEPSGKVLAGCQCINPVIEPSDWIADPTQDLSGYSTADNPTPAPQQVEIDTRPQPAPVPVGNQQVRQNDQQSSSSHASSSSRSSSDCYGDDCDGVRKKIIRSHYDEVEQYLSVRDRDLARMNDEYLRVKQGESNIRNQDKAMDALVEKSRCCDDQKQERSNNEYTHHDGGGSRVVYVQGGGGTACGCNPGYCAHGMGGVTNVNAGLSLNFGGGMPQVYPQHYRPYGRGQVVPMYQPAPIVTGGGQVLRPTRGPNNR